MLVSSLLWCPSDQDERADIIIEHLSNLLVAIDRSGCDVTLLLVDNDVVHVRVRDFIKSINTCVIRSFVPQLGWARGRNYAIDYWMSTNPGPSDRIVLCDCDQLFKSDDWLYKVNELSITHPDYHAYMIRPDKESIYKSAKLNSGLVVDIYNEWLGTTNVFSPHAINTIGGYDTTLFPVHWGWSDPLQGRYLKKSQLLNNVHGFYTDPIRVEGVHGHSDKYTKDFESMHNEIIRTYNNKFLQVEADILSGKLPLFTNYK